MTCFIIIFENKAKLKKPIHLKVIEEFLSYVPLQTFLENNFLDADMPSKIR